MDGELTPRQIREGLADVGRLELAYLNVEREVLDSGAKFIELHEELEHIFNTGGELSFNKEQAALVFLAVRFTSVFRTLNSINQSFDETMKG